MNLYDSIVPVVIFVMQMKKIVLLIFVLLPMALLSQQKIALQWHKIDSAATSLFTNKNEKDSAAALLEMNLQLKKARQKGYLSTSIDTFYFSQNTLHAFIYTGEKFNSIHIANGNLEKNYLSLLKKSNNNYSFKEAEQLIQSVLNFAENHGYPFAEVFLDSFEWNSNHWQAKIFLIPNSYIFFDTLTIKGNSKVRSIFLRNYLGIKYGKPYNESVLKKITPRLNELPFLESGGAHTVDFRAGSAKVNVITKKRKSSQFDVLIGLLPGSSGQKVLITGHATLHLHSLLGVGEELYLHWEKLQPKTQRLDVKVVYPYILGFPIGANVAFSLFKKDTSFLDLNGNYGVQYQLSGNNFIKAAYQQKTTIVTTVDTTYIKTFRRLPPLLDVSSNEFSLNIFLQKLDYKFNPLKGYVIDAQLSAGAKKIKKNTVIATLYDGVGSSSFNYLYDSISKNIFQMQAGLFVEKYWKIHKRMTIKTAFEGKYFLSKLILENEKYRIGGIKTLRGFDDQSIYTPYYGIATIEYRFLLSKNSNFYTFFNAAVVQDNRTTNNKTVDFPYGFGIGASLETKVGMFGISYAMGTQLGNPITFRSSKIHFGYVNYF